MLQLLLQPLALFLGFTILSCTFCAAYLFPRPDFTAMLTRIGRAMSRRR